MTRDDAPEFVLFCTIDGVTEPFVIGVTNNEIDAVALFSEHIDVNGDSHIPYVHMERRRVAWVDGVVPGFWAYEVELAAADNLFRVPPARVQRMAEAMS